MTLDHLRSDPEQAPKAPGKHKWEKCLGDKGFKMNGKKLKI